MMAGAAALAAAPPPAPRDERDVLAEWWTGMYDMSEELITGSAGDSPLAPLTEQQRVQINVRRIQVPWLGTHVLYVEEYPYDEPFERRRRVLLSILPGAADGELRVRQYTRRAEAPNSGTLTATDVESVAGCDLWLAREGAQYRGGTRGRDCLTQARGERRWIDYRVVIGEGLFWYRQRTLTLDGDDIVGEIAGIPHLDLHAARLFTCGIRWSSGKPNETRRPLETVELHDRGGRARFRTPDGRDLQLELHGRDWPLSTGRESLVLILTADRAVGEPIASSWTSLDAARVGIDIGWLAVDCAPLVADSGEQPS
jgi:hypothetical protein